MLQSAPSQVKHYVNWIYTNSHQGKFTIISKKLFHTNTAKEGNPPEEEEVDSSE